MKFKILKRKIIVAASLLLILFVILFTIYAFIDHQKKDKEKEIMSINNLILSLTNQISEMQNKISEANKYQEIWKLIGQKQKELTLINIEETSKNVEKIAQKYNIIKPKVLDTKVEQLNSGVFKRNTVEVSYAPMTIEFESPNDARALMFVTEFLNSLNGYAIVNNFEIRKVKSYEEKDLVELSKGEGFGAISGRVAINWYTTKLPNQGVDTEKDNQTKKLEKWLKQKQLEGNQ